MLNAKKAESMSAHAFSQFRLTTNIVTKLNTFKLTPIAKLVLLYLSTCYNPKHKEIFPKQKTIADKLGISERSVTRAIQELFKEGLILIECKYTNRYKFTSRIVQEQAENMSDDLGQNDTQQKDNLSHHELEPINEHEKEPLEREILKSYAIKHNAKNVNAYINTLKNNGSAVKIIKEYKKQKFITQRAENAIKETESLLSLYTSYKNDSVTPDTCSAWVEFGKKINRLQKQPELELKI